MIKAWICISILLVVLSVSLAQTRKRADPKKTSAPPAPLAYSEVLEGVEGVVKKHWGEDELIQYLVTHKVDFPITDGVKEDLKKHGASDKVIEALLQVAPPAPPPEVKPKKIQTGALSIRCAPADCDISLNGQAAGSTQNGELNLADLRIGDAVIDFARKGYITQQKSVQISADTSIPVSATLEPDNSTKAEFGRQAARHMLTALGLEKDRKQLWALAASGSATSWDADGKDSEWSLEFAFGAPNLLKMDARGPAGNITLLCRGEHCVPKKKGGLLGGNHSKAPALDGLTANLMLFARCDYAAMLDRLTSPSNQMSAPSFEEAGEHDQHFTVRATDVSFDVLLGAQLWPTSIVWTPKSGLGAGLTITFGAYTRFADFQYPSHTDIKLPGAGQRGIQIRFDSLRQELNLREAEFPQ
jgi:hypothetical protein